MRTSEDIRSHNPFHDPLVTELIEDPKQYHKMFSESILIGETLKVFQPANVVLLGPQGAGKSMILNLIRYRVLSEWLTDDGIAPSHLEHVLPFLGISINLVRSNFHTFGRRSVSRSRYGTVDENLDASAAADYLSHYLLREFLIGLQFIASEDGAKLTKWMHLDLNVLSQQVVKLAQSSSWSGYYQSYSTLDDLRSACEHRLSTWRQFLNTSIDDVPDEIRNSMSTMEDCLHSMGNCLRSLGSSDRDISLFVVIDQYEVLPELSPAFGTTLQRVINSCIKQRDPVVFYKIGARTHDWGHELRIWGAESRIEFQRDYSISNLAEALMRTEGPGWVFPRFARDVAYKRITATLSQVDPQAVIDQFVVEEIFGKWTGDAESWLYFPVAAKSKDIQAVAKTVLRDVSRDMKLHIVSCLTAKDTPLDVRLMEAWVLQRQEQGLTGAEIKYMISQGSWKNASWRKERVEIALLQLVSKTHSTRRYFGWSTICALSGSNILAFLLLCGEIWDMAAKRGQDPLTERPLSPLVQSEGVFVASVKWRNRDQHESIGGQQRHSVVGRIGPAIHDSLVKRNPSLSNPGHSGFSISLSEGYANDQDKRVREFLDRAVSWAIFEERRHTSKQRGDLPRIKYYLHPLFSPVFGIPHTRVKEPMYVSVPEVWEWLFTNRKIRFGRTANQQRLAGPDKGTSTQLQIPWGDS